VFWINRGGQKIPSYELHERAAKRGRGRLEFGQNTRGGEKVENAT